MEAFTVYMQVLMVHPAAAPTQSHDRSPAQQDGNIGLNGSAPVFDYLGTNFRLS